METQHSRHRISFVTGINDNFFLLACQLMHSLERYFPRVPFYVMDFGLSEGPKEFFRRRGMLLAMPHGLDRHAHPYTFKSAMGSLFSQKIGIPVWLDADILAVRDGTQALQLAADAMLQRAARFAVAAADAGDLSLARFCLDYSAPRLAQFLAQHPEIADRTYVNVGVLMFRQADRLDDWRELSGRFEGDMCWEQNALNVLGHTGPAGMDILEPRVWNVHGILHDALESREDGLYCDGMPCIFLHATSSFARHVEQGQVDFAFGRYTYPNYFKFFVHPGLRRQQGDFLNEFSSLHVDEMHELGMLS